MGQAMAPLEHLEAFHELTVNMSQNPFLGVAIGTLFTVLVQSSSATIGILQQLFSEGLIQLKAALPVLFGDNIGTTVTALLASIGTGVAAKRTAFVHVFFNLIGVTIFMLLLDVFTQYVIFLQESFSLSPEMTIAFAHGSLNIINTIIQFPFIAGLAWLVTKIIPGNDVTVEHKPQHLDPIFIQQSPSVALDQAKLEVVRMGQYAHQGLDETSQYLLTGKQKHSDMAMQVEGALNNLDHEITSYLVNISKESLSTADSEQHTALMDAVHDIERIGDHFENIIELVDYKKANKVKLTEQAQTDLDHIFTLTMDTVQLAVETMEHEDTDTAQQVLTNETAIDESEKDLRKRHIERMNQGLCSGSAGIVFVDILSNLERIGDHSVNIAQKIIKEQ